MAKSTKKFKVPKTVEVGGILYEVTYPYIFDDDSPDCLAGSHNWPSAVIRIGEQANSQKLVEVLIHELVHAIDHVYNQGTLSKNEPMVERLSCALYYLFSRNKILTSVKIPNKIDINGFIYTVDSNKVFHDSIESYTSSTDLELQRICIINQVDNVNLTIPLKKVHLINMALFVICNILQISDEEMELIDRMSFSHGIYQVFRNANIEELAWLSKRS